VRRQFRGGRVLDLGGGHGLLGQIMLLLDDTSPTALVVDKAPPPSGPKVHEALVRAWPRLSGRVEFRQGDLGDVSIADTDVVVANHACGTLTDHLLGRAAAARARVAVLPCCHNEAASDTGGLTGWLDGALAIDVVRAGRLCQSGYRVWTQTIPAEITPMNRLLLGAPISRTMDRAPDWALPQSGGSASPESGSGRFTASRPARRSQKSADARRDRRSAR
jgi:hypothetical protein